MKSYWLLVSGILLTLLVRISFASIGCASTFRYQQDLVNGTDTTRLVTRIGPNSDSGLSESRSAPSRVMPAARAREACPPRVRLSKRVYTGPSVRLSEWSSAGSRPLNHVSHELASQEGSTCPMGIGARPIPPTLPRAPSGALPVASAATALARFPLSRFAFQRF